MKKIRVHLKDRSYDIIIASGLIQASGAMARSLNIGATAVIITNRKLSSLYGRILTASFNKAGIEARFIFVPDSEKAKSLRTAGEVLAAISRLDRNKPLFIVAFGGGVIGDLAGFTASVYKRGIPYIQIPTTLLAQVDSSIGGKTAVDLPIAKNMVGAFYQPRAVLTDVSLTASLPLRQLRSGLAEVIKYGVIKDPALFSYVGKNLKKILKGDRTALEFIISRSAAIKADVVSADEYDRKGVRMALNFGHTIGHAIEAAGSYAPRYNHGEAVAIGMAAASKIAETLGITDRKTPARIESIIKSAGLPVTVSGIKAGRIYDSLLRDKKFAHGMNRFVLPVKIGAVKTVKRVPDRIIKDAINGRIR